MTVRLAVAFTDVRAADLRFSLDEPDRAPLASRTVRAGSTTLELRVLGASHQVVVDRDGLRLLTETLACDVAAGTSMPAQVEDGNGYHFTSLVQRPDDFAGAVAAVEALVADNPHGVVAGFPGSADAITAVLVDSLDPLAWRTWHAYPNTGELVVTTTRHTATEVAA